MRSPFLMLVVQKAFYERSELSKKEFKGKFKFLGKDLAEALYDELKFSGIVQNGKKGRLYQKSGFDMLK